VVGAPIVHEISADEAGTAGYEEFHAVCLAVAACSARFVTFGATRG
jgi:hypothetical protein